MKASFNLVIFCLLFVSCTSLEVKKEKEAYKIFSLLIEEFGKALPPPPPPGETYSLTKSQKDSIYNQPQKIAIHPTFYISREKFSNNGQVSKEFNSLAKKLNTLKNESLFDLSKISIKKPFELSILDTLKMKKERRYFSKNFDKVISFSHISFNKSLDKAVLIIGSSRGYLNGASSLIYLEKVNDLWKVKNINTYSIS